MAVVADGRGTLGFAAWPGDITRLQTLSLSPASQGINEMVRPAAHMGSREALQPRVDVTVAGLV